MQPLRRRVIAPTHTQHPPGLILGLLLSKAPNKVIFDSDDRAKRAERARDKEKAGLRMLQEQWADFERWSTQADIRTSDVCSQFSRITAIR